MAALAGSFVSMVQMERAAAQKRLWGTRALLLARAGTEDALARLSAGQEDVYGGENWDGDPAGQLSFYEASQEVFQPTGAGSAADVSACPVQHALRPSFFVRAGGNPAVAGIAGRDRGYSGCLRGDRIPLGNLYGLKVEDESAKIYVNGGFLDALDRDADGLPDHRDPDVRPASAPPSDTGRGWNAQLARLLDVLGAQPEVGIPSLGTQAIQSRPPGGYASVAALEASLGAKVDLSPFLTVSSWVDAKVVHPNAYTAQPAVQAFAEIKKGRAPLALEEGGRAPVNLNAAPRPVLVALLEGLEGVDWQDESKPQVRSIAAAQAAQIADAIVARRATDPFDTWAEFGAFCDGLVGGVIAVTATSGCPQASLEAADLLKANFDPNTRLNKELPDQLGFRWIDKSDLTVWSSEGCLAPTGVYRIAAVGRCLNERGMLTAERHLASVHEVFALIRQTTQQDFVAGRAMSQGYLSLARPGDFTLGISSPSWWGGAPPGRGLAVVTYPCHPSALPGNAAVFDGGIALATMEVRPTDLNGAPTFLHHFDDGWHADAGSGNPTLQPTPTGCGLRLQTDPAASVWPATSAEPATLYPDGMHAQGARSPAYAGPANFPLVDASNQTNHAAIAFWAKTNKTARSASPEIFVSIQDLQNSFSGVKTQVLLIGRKRVEDIWGIAVESQIAMPSADYLHEIQRRVDLTSSGVERLPGLRWQLLNLFVDTARQRGLGEDADIRIQSLPASLAGPASYDPPAYTSDLDLASSRNLMAGSPPLVLGMTNVMSVAGGGTMGGGGGGGPVAQYYPANTVMDEFAIFDFSPLPAAKNWSDMWGSVLYQDGRYYKGDDGVYTSPLFQPGAGADVHLLRAWWTAYRPSEPRLEALVDTVTGLPLSPAPRPVDPALAEADVEVRLLDGAYATLALTLRQGGRIGLGLPTFAYEVRFTTGLAGQPGIPALETPFFDDITLAYQGPGGPRALGWQ